MEQKMSICMWSIMNLNYFLHRKNQNKCSKFTSNLLFILFRTLIKIHMRGTCNNWLNQFYSFSVSLLSQVHASHSLCALGFLKLLWFVHQYMSVCLSPRALITIDVIWCDIDYVWFIKQVLWLFPAFNYFIWHLPLIKYMGVAILTQHIVNTC